MVDLTLNLHCAAVQFDKFLDQRQPDTALPSMERPRAPLTRWNLSNRCGTSPAGMPVPVASSTILFDTIPGGEAALSTALEAVVIPVLDRSKGVDLRGKTVQITITRDFRSLSPDAVEKLNEKWKDYGAVWTGVAESNAMTFYMPKTH